VIVTVPGPTIVREFPKTVATDELEVSKVTASPEEAEAESVKGAEELRTDDEDKLKVMVCTAWFTTTLTFVVAVV
jgi:hypothetical protein